MTKSIDQVRLGASGGAAADVLLPDLYDVVCVLHQPVKVVKTVHALVINMKAFTAQ
jgi:hypothetical protein